jgi:hypothetical protein
MKYEQIVDGSWHQWDRKDNWEECCDCALTHRAEYKVVNGKIWFRCWREDKLTNAKRKRRGIKIAYSTDRRRSGGTASG